MSTVYLIAAFFGIFTTGILIGISLERRSWLCRSIPKNSSSAHNCNGEFYYIIEEGYFCREYVRRDSFPMVKKESEK